MLWNAISDDNSIDFNSSHEANNTLDDQLFQIRCLYNKALKHQQLSSIVGDDLWLQSKASLEEIQNNIAFNIELKNSPLQAERDKLKILTVKNLAKIYESEGKLSTALDMLLGIVPMNTSDIVALNRIAIISLKLGEYWISNAILNCDTVINANVTAFRNELANNLEYQLNSDQNFNKTPASHFHPRISEELIFYGDEKQKTATELLIFLSFVAKSARCSLPVSVNIRANCILTLPDDNGSTLPRRSDNTVSINTSSSRGVCSSVIYQTAMQIDETNTSSSYLETSVISASALSKNTPHNGNIGPKASRFGRRVRTRLEADITAVPASNISSVICLMENMLQHELPSCLDPELLYALDQSLISLASLDCILDRSLKSLMDSPLAMSCGNNISPPVCRSPAVEATKPEDASSESLSAALVDSLYEFMRSILIGGSGEQLKMANHTLAISAGEQRSVSLLQFQSEFLAHVIKLFADRIRSAGNVDERPVLTDPRRASASASEHYTNREHTEISLDNLRIALWSCWISLYRTHENRPEELMMRLNDNELLFVAELCVYFLIQPSGIGCKEVNYTSGSHLNQGGDDIANDATSLAQSALIWILTCYDWNFSELTSGDSNNASDVHTLSTTTIRRLWVIFLCDFFRLVSYSSNSERSSFSWLFCEGMCVGELMLKAVTRSGPVFLTHISNDDKREVDIASITINNVIDIIQSNKYRGDELHLLSLWRGLTMPHIRDCVIEWKLNAVSYLNKRIREERSRAASVGGSDMPTGSSSACTVDFNEDEGSELRLESGAVPRISTELLICVMDASNESYDSNLLQDMVQFVFATIYSSDPSPLGGSVATVVRQWISLTNGLLRSIHAFIGNEDASGNGPKEFIVSENTILSAVACVNYLIAHEVYLPLLPEVSKILTALLRFCIPTGSRQRCALAALIAAALNIVFNLSDGQLCASNYRSLLSLIVSLNQSITDYSMLPPHVLSIFAYKAALRYDSFKGDSVFTNEGARLEDVGARPQDRSDTQGIVSKSLAHLAFIAVISRCLVTLLGSLEGRIESADSYNKNRYMALIKILCLIYEECAQVTWDSRLIEPESNVLTNVVEEVNNKLLSVLLQQDELWGNLEQCEAYKPTRKLLLLTCRKYYFDKYGISPISAIHGSNSATDKVATVSPVDLDEVCFIELNARDLFEIFYYTRACDEAGLSNRNKVRHLYAKLLQNDVLSSGIGNDYNDFIATYLFHTESITDIYKIQDAHNDSNHQFSDDSSLLNELLKSIPDVGPMHKGVADRESINECTRYLLENFYVAYARHGIDGEHLLDTISTSRGADEADVTESRCLPLIRLHLQDLKFSPNRFESWLKLYMSTLEYIQGVTDELADCIFLDYLPTEFHNRHALLLPSLRDLVLQNLCLQQGRGRGTCDVLEEIEGELRVKINSVQVKHIIPVAYKDICDRIIRLCVVKNSTFVLLQRTLRLCSGLLGADCIDNSDECTPVKRRLALIDAWENQGLLMYHLASQYLKGSQDHKRMLSLALGSFGRAITICQDGGDCARFFLLFMSGKLEWQLNRDTTKSLKYFLSAASALDASKMTYSTKVLKRCKQALMYQMHATRLRSALSMLDNLGKSYSCDIAIGTDESGTGGDNSANFIALMITELESCSYKSAQPSTNKQQNLIVNTQLLEGLPDHCTHHIAVSDRALVDEDSDAEGIDNEMNNDSDSGEGELTAPEQSVDSMSRTEAACDLADGTNIPPKCVIRDQTYLCSCEPTSMAVKRNDELMTRLWRVVADAMQALQCCRRRDPFDTKPIYRIAVTLLTVSADADVGVLNGDYQSISNMNAYHPQPSSVIQLRFSPPTWLSIAVGVEDVEVTCTASPDRTREDGNVTASSTTRANIFSAEIALREMGKMFDKKRDQIVALWVRETASHKIDQYISFYLILLLKTKSLERCLELFRFILESSEDSTARRWMCLQTRKCLLDIVRSQTWTTSTEAGYKQLLHAVYVVYCSDSMEAPVAQAAGSRAVEMNPYPDTDVALTRDRNIHKDNVQDINEQCEGLMASLFKSLSGDDVSSPRSITDVLKACALTWPEVRFAVRSNKMSVRRALACKSTESRTSGLDVREEDSQKSKKRKTTMESRIDPNSRTNALGSRKKLSMEAVRAMVLKYAPPTTSLNSTSLAVKSATTVLDSDKSMGSNRKRKSIEGLNNFLVRLKRRQTASVESAGDHTIVPTDTLGDTSLPPKDLTTAQVFAQPALVVAPGALGSLPGRPLIAMQRSKPSVRRTSIAVPKSVGDRKAAARAAVSALLSYYNITSTIHAPPAVAAEKSEEVLS